MLEKRAYWIFVVVFMLMAGSVLAEPLQVKSARYWTSPERTRMVLDITGSSSHSVTLMKNPDRVVIDIRNARLQRKLAQPRAKSSALIKKVRTGVRNNNNLRVVLDLKSAVKPKVFLLKPNDSYGHRLVVDLYHRRSSSPVRTIEAKKSPIDQKPTRLAKKKSSQHSMAPKLIAKSGATKKSEITQVSKESVRKGEPTPVRSVARRLPDKSKRTTDPVVKKREEPSFDIDARADAITAQVATLSAARNKQVAQHKPPTKTVKVEKKAIKSYRRYGRDLIVAVDAGHGGEDPGARGSKGTKEKVVVLAIARKLASLINKTKGMKAVLVRNGDYYISLRGRMRKARKARADLFISIHADAFRQKSVRGSSVFTLSRKGATSEAARWLAAKENAADMVGGVSLDDKSDLLASVLMDLSQTATREASMDVATRVLSSLGKVGKRHSSHVQKAGFAVLKSPDIPSILVETAFISNPTEEMKLRSSAHQTRVAKAIFSGIRDYFAVRAPITTGSVVASNNHVISEGETLGGIAKRYGVSLKRLQSQNAVTDGKINAGQVIKIPRGS